MARAAGDFFLESLSSFEMVQRGYREAREAARLERRQTEMSRQLSASSQTPRSPSTPPTHSKRWFYNRSIFRCLREMQPF